MAIGKENCAMGKRTARQVEMVCNTHRGVIIIYNMYRCSNFIYNIYIRINKTESDRVHLLLLRLFLRKPLDMCR